MSRQQTHSTHYMQSQFLFTTTIETTEARCPISHLDPQQLWLS